MSIKINGSTHSYLQLNKADQSAIPKQLMEKYEKLGVISQTFSGRYKSALLFMAGKKKESELTPEEKELFVELNTEAKKTLDAAAKELNVEVEKTLYVTPWKGHLGNLQILTYLLPLGAKVNLVGAAVSAGMTLLYLRSHKVLVVANACAACAFLVLCSTCFKLRDTFKIHHKTIDTLNLQNFDQFSEKAIGVFEGLKKTNYLMRFYLNAHQSRMGNEQQGLKFLWEQLYAIHHIKHFMMKLLVPSFLPGVSIIPVEGQVDLNAIKAFFVKFEALCRKGVKGTIGIGVLTLAWSYYAYVQKARLMVLAGMVYFLGSLVISRQLFVLQRGSRNIRLAEDGQINEKFREMAAQSFLLRRMGVQKANEAQIHQAVVIPFDAILKLIPAWKSEAPVHSTTGRSS